MVKIILNAFLSQIFFCDCPPRVPERRGAVGRAAGEERPVRGKPKVGHLRYFLCFFANKKDIFYAFSIKLV